MAMNGGEGSWPNVLRDRHIMRFGKTAEALHEKSNVEFLVEADDNYVTSALPDCAGRYEIDSNGAEDIY